MQPVFYTMIYCCACRYVSLCKSCILYTNSHTWKICILHARLSLSELQPACWVSVWELILTCDLPYANTRVIIVRLPVNTDWLIDASSRGGSIWDKIYTSCRRGADLWFAVCRHTRYNGMTPCEHWLIDWHVHTRKLSLRHFATCLLNLCLRTEFNLWVPYANTRVIIVRPLWALTNWWTRLYEEVPLRDKLHVLSTRSTQWFFKLWFAYVNTRVMIARLPLSTDWLTDSSSRGGPFETQITRLVDAEYPVELKPRYLLASLLRTKGKIVQLV
jgi:hypothetical protein